MNILETIMLRKRAEVALRKELTSVKELEKDLFFNSPVSSFTQSVLNPQRSGIIAEYKRQSPSKGIINEVSSLAEVIPAYDLAGVSAISVLTDSHFFGGNIYDLFRARQLTEIPLLRKDFIYDEYQLLEARSAGAAAILLIAAVLTKKELDRLARFARSLQLEVLMEIHGEDELEKISDYGNAVGVNNRNLKDFKVATERSVELAALIPDRFVKIAESGIHSTQQVSILRNAGFNGFLMGERFMATMDPGGSCRDFIEELRKN